MLDLTQCRVPSIFAYMLHHSTWKALYPTKSSYDFASSSGTWGNSSLPNPLNNPLTIEFKIWESQDSGTISRGWQMGLGFSSNVKGKLFTNAYAYVYDQMREVEGRF
ncbi:predicted protein [Histoplasma capsulatum G186AR]|uniref:Uncharacterized protein n=1 Tax=Ajellomyces capsulatus (strain G186AR / H82 / ATCC MYA-2454 / RMSCC 2432) TaxID=447093 RepID=C0NQY9_AJECG|nr:uncharacterized protein HCBG_05419 [Histoplasma capsulatum G186AR]EEH06103.1 predicted protein [Histoplasma capsulatum G186AR]